MGTEPVLGQLLHLGALAVVLTAGYLGLDRIRAGRHRFAEDLRRIEIAVAGLLLEMGVTRNDRVTLRRAYDSWEVHVLCFVANKPIRLRWRWPVCFVLRQWYFPLLRYFRFKYDFWCVSVLLCVSIGLFLLANASIVWPTVGWPIYTRPILPLLTPESCFLCFTVATLWIVLTAVAGYRLLSIRKLCDELESRVKARIIEMAEDIKDTLKV